MTKGKCPHEKTPLRPAPAPPACARRGSALPRLQAPRPASVPAYSDVAADAWYAEAVEAVSLAGYMTGTSETAFSPNAAVTRATVVTVLWRLEGAPAFSVEAPFPDVAAGAWYETAAAWAKGKGHRRRQRQGTLQSRQRRHPAGAGRPSPPLRPV